jgi:hypothetical protein
MTYFEWFTCTVAAVAFVGVFVACLEILKALNGL